MRRLNCLLCLVLLIMALPHSRAEASVTNDPIDITILEPPGDLESGQAHVMTVRLEAYGPAFSTERASDAAPGASISKYGVPKPISWSSLPRTSGRRWVKRFGRR